MASRIIILIGVCFLFAMLFLSCMRNGNVISKEVAADESKKKPNNKELILGFWRLDSIVIEDKTINKNVFSESFSKDSLYCFRLDTLEIKCEYKGKIATVFTLSGDTILDHEYDRKFKRLYPPYRRRIILKLNAKELIYNMPNNGKDQIHYLSRHK